MGPIYLDHAATTVPRAEVVEAVAAHRGLRNPSSVHSWGREARAALEDARERIAAVLGANRREIIFTGGGTEANNLAVLGRARAVSRAGGVPVVVRSAVEHSAVAGPTEQAGREGAEIVVLGVDENGVVPIESIGEALSREPALVSVMWGNNEVGSLQPVAEIASRCRASGVVFHTDAVQAFGWEPVRVDEIDCDLLTLSAHKIGGPRGIGALYVRSGTELGPLAFGGGQESALRPGTQDVAAAVGFAVAAERAAEERDRESRRVRALRDRLQDGLAGRIPDLRVNGGGAERLPHILSVSVPAAEREALLMALDLEGIAVSSGSACHSGAAAASPTLTAMGAAQDGAAAIRFSLGRTTTDAEIDAAIERVPGVVERMRALAAM